MGDATDRLATLQRGLRDLREVVASLDDGPARSALAARIDALEARAALWGDAPGPERVALLNDVFEATLEASDARRRSGVWPRGPIKSAK